MLSIPIYKYFRNVFLLIFGLFHLKLYSQISATYSINADLKLKDRLIIINQKVKVSNNSSKVLDTLFFNDWSNSYRDTKTPLAQRLAEEFDRSFYFSSPRSKGKTAIRNIKIGNKSINWERLKNQNDIIKIILKDPLTNNDTILFLRTRSSSKDCKICEHNSKDELKFILFADKKLALNESFKRIL